MARKKNTVPTYLLHKPTGQARVRIEGRDYYLGPFGSDESRRKYVELIGSGGVAALANRGNRGSDDGCLTIGELIVSFLNWAEAYYVKDGKLTSQLSRIHMAMRPLNKHFGALPADQFGPLKLRTLRDLYVAHGYVRSTVNAFVFLVQKMFRHGVDHEMFDERVYWKLKSITSIEEGKATAVGQPIAPDRPRRQPVSVEKQEAVRSRVQPMVRDLIDLQLFSDARSGELVKLTTAMLDRSTDVWTANLKSHKTSRHGHTRTLYFGPKSQLILRRYVNDAAKDRRLFPITRCAYCRAITRACDVAFGMPVHLRKIPRKLAEAEKVKLRKEASEWRAENCWTPHWLRHTTTTRVVDEFDEESAQVMAGHSKAETTRGYTSFAQAKAFEVARKIG